VWEASQARQAAGEAAALADSCQNMAWQLVSLAERSLTWQRATGAHTVDRKVWRQWVELFLAGECSNLDLLSA
jgi:hypothetical protein